MTSPPGSKLCSAMASRRSWRQATTLPPLLLLAGLSAGCQTSIAVNRPATACSTLVPQSLKAPTPGWPIPQGDGVKDWAAGFVGQSGQLERANVEKSAGIEIIQACEARDLETVKALTKRRRVLGIF